MKGETYATLSKLHKEISNPIDALNSLDRANLWSDVVVYLTVNCFDPATQRDWQKSLGDSAEPPTRKQLDKFINERLATLESLESSFKPTSSGTTHRSSKVNEGKPQIRQQTSSDSKGNPCLLCNGDHFIIACSKFRNMTPKERKNTVDNNRLCPNCLGRHKLQGCTSEKRCKQCRYKHHSMLHFNAQTKGESRSVVTQQSSVDTRG